MLGNSAEFLNSQTVNALTKDPEEDCLRKGLLHAHTAERGVGGSAEGNDDQRQTGKRLIPRQVAIFQ